MTNKQEPTKIQLGQRYGRLSNAMATMGLRDYIAIMVVVDMTDNSVALRIESDNDLALCWLLKTDINDCLELIV